jgi:hypothetical protein
MHFAGSDSWQISHGQPLHLVLALFVRDRAGLGHVGDPLLPALDPPVSVRPLPPIDLEAARQQWAAWWSQCWSQDQRLTLMQISEPGLPAFGEVPALQRLLLLLLDEAGRWSSRRHDEGFRSIVRRRETGSVDDLGDLVRQRERQLRRRARPFRLSITELPVAGTSGWRLGPEDLVVTVDLVRDREAFLAFVRPAVEAVA